MVALRGGVGYCSGVGGTGPPAGRGFTMDASAARTALETCDLVALLRSVDCDQFSEADIHGPVCSARIGRTVYLIPPSNDASTDGVRTSMQGVMVARHNSDESAMEHYAVHERAMHRAAMIHDMVCNAHGDGHQAVNPLMELLGSTTPDVLPHDWQS